MHKHRPYTYLEIKTHDLGAYEPKTTKYSKLSPAPIPKYLMIFCQWYDFLLMTANYLETRRRHEEDVGGCALLPRFPNFPLQHHQS